MTHHVSRGLDARKSHPSDNRQHAVVDLKQWHRNDDHQQDAEGQNRKPFAFEDLVEGGPRLENGVSVTRATYWGKSNLERNLLCYLPQTSLRT